MFNLLHGAVPYREEDIVKYVKHGWWRSMTLGDCLDLASDMHPRKEAFIDQKFSLTYGEAREKVDRLAIGMMRLGIEPLDRVMVQLPNWIEFVFAYFACQKIGAITVLLIDRYRPYEIGRIIEITGANSWIVPRRLQKIDFAPIIHDVLKNHPEIANVITVRGKMELAKSASLEELIENSILTEKSLFELVKRRPNPMQVAHMGPTGGTTGEPKIVPRTHNSLICGVEHCSMSWDQHCEDVNMIVGPVGHDLSFTKGFLGSVITQGKLVFQESRKNSEVCKTIEEENVTSVIWVPTIAQRLLNYENLDCYDLSSLKKIHIGGGASHPEFSREFLSRFNVRIYSGYGGTEGMTTITRSVDDCETVSRTVGRQTFPYDEYRVVDLDGNEVSPNSPGELLVKGPCIFSGYYNDSDLNRRIFDENGFFRTGDLAVIDEYGYITLIGRIKDMINRGGESICAIDIENIISMHPQIVAVAVVPMPDKVMGERVCAYIETKSNVSLSFEDVISFLKEKKVSIFQFPERIEFVDKLPTTKAEKLDRFALRKDIENKIMSNLDCSHLDNFRQF